jgi:hypothetical protein
VVPRAAEKQSNRSYPHYPHTRGAPPATEATIAGGPEEGFANAVDRYLLSDGPLISSSCRCERNRDRVISVVAITTIEKQPITAVFSIYK